MNQGSFDDTEALRYSLSTLPGFPPGVLVEALGDIADWLLARHRGQLRAVAIGLVRHQAPSHELEFARIGAQLARAAGVPGPAQDSAAPLRADLGATAEAAFLLRFPGTSFTHDRFRDTIEIANTGLGRGASLAYLPHLSSGPSLSRAGRRRSASWRH